MLFCSALLAWQLLLSGFIGMADNGDFSKMAGPVCLGSADAEIAGPQFFQPNYLRGNQFCYHPQVPSSEVAVVWLASSVQQRLGDPARFDIRWLGSLHAIAFLAFYYLILRLLRPLNLAPRLFLSLVALWVFADVGLISYFNSFSTDVAAILGGLLAAVLAVQLIARKSPGAGLVALFGLAALLFTLSKAQHGVFGVIPAALAALSGRRARDTRTRVVAYSTAVVLLLGTVYVVSATPDWYKAQPRFNVMFTKLARNAQDLRELGLDAEDASYIGMKTFMPFSPMQNPSWRDRFSARTSYGRILAFYVRHPDRALAILQSDLRDEAWQRRSFGLSNYPKERGFPTGTLAGRLSSWSYLRMQLFRLWPTHILVWYALLLPASLLIVLRDSSPFRRSLTWIVLALSVMAAGEFGIASLADALETSRHMLMFHVFTDCSFFLALVFAASRWEATARIEHSRTALLSALGALGFLAMLMLWVDVFPDRAITRRATSSGWVDNTSPLLTYSGRWESGTFRGAYGETLSYSAASGAWVRFDFEGTTLEYLYTKTFNRGLALVTIDGIERGVIDLYDPRVVWQVSTVFGGLKPGRHTAEIRVAGRRNPASTDYFVDIDALQAR